MCACDRLDIAFRVLEHIVFFCHSSAMSEKKKNLNEASREELIAIVKQLHNRLHQFHEGNHPHHQQQRPALDQQARSEYETRIATLLEQSKLLKGEISQLEKGRSALEGQLRRAEEKKSADEATICELKRQLEDGGLRDEKKQKQYPPAPNTTVVPHGVEKDRRAASLVPPPYACQSASTTPEHPFSEVVVQTRSAAVDELKHTIKELEAALEGAQDKINDLSAYNHYWEVQQRREKEKGADAIVEEDEEVNLVDRRGPSTIGRLSRDDNVDHQSNEEMLAIKEEECRQLRENNRKLRVDAELSTKAAERYQREAQELLHLCALLQRAAIDRGPPAVLSSMSSVLGEELSPDAKSGNVQQTTTQRNVQADGSHHWSNVPCEAPPDQKEHRRGDDAHRHTAHATPPAASSAVSSSNHNTNDALMPQQAAVLLCDAGNTNSHHSLSSAAVDAHGKPLSRSGGSYADDMGSLTQQQHNLPPHQQRPRSGPAFLASLPVVQLRGATPREKKLLERIKLLEDSIRTTDTIDATRQRQAEEAEQRRGELMAGMRQQIASLKSEVSKLRADLSAALMTSSNRNNQQPQNHHDIIVEGDVRSASAGGNSPTRMHQEDSVAVAPVPPPSVSNGTQTETQVAQLGKQQPSGSPPADNRGEDAIIGEQEQRDGEITQAAVGSDGSSSMGDVAASAECVSAAVDHAAVSNAAHEQATTNNEDLLKTIGSLEMQLAEAKSRAAEREERFSNAVAAVRAIKERAATLDKELGAQKHQTSILEESLVRAQQQRAAETMLWSAQCDKYQTAWVASNVWSSELWNTLFSAALSPSSTALRAGVALGGGGDDDDGALHREIEEDLSWLEQVVWPSSRHRTASGGDGGSTHLGTTGAAGIEEASSNSGAPPHTFFSDWATEFTSPTPQRGHSSVPSGKPPLPATVEFDPFA